MASPGRYRAAGATTLFRGIRERESKGIAERKKSLAGKLANVAELGAKRMEETIGKASLRDPAIGTGIAVDKMLALTGQTSNVNIVNVWMPSEQECAEMGALDNKLDAHRQMVARVRAGSG